MMEEPQHFVRVIPPPSTILYHGACRISRGHATGSGHNRRRDLDQADPTVLKSLSTTAAGLSLAEVDMRRRRYGLNQPRAHRRRPLWLEFLTRFLNPLVLILLFASALSAATGNVTSFVIVIVMVHAQRHSGFRPGNAGRKRGGGVAPLRRRACQVRRDGVEVSEPIESLVPGDVVHLVGGDLVPADGRLIEARDLFVNQAMLTGEPYPAEKTRSISATRAPDPGEAPTSSSWALPSSAAAPAPWSAERARPPRSAGWRQLWRRRRPPPSSWASGVRVPHLAPDDLPGAVRAGGERAVPPALAGIAAVRAGAGGRADARTAADDRHRHAGPRGACGWRQRG